LLAIRSLKREWGYEGRSGGEASRKEIWRPGDLFCTDSYVEIPLAYDDPWAISIQLADEDSGKLVKMDLDSLDSFDQKESSKMHRGARRPAFAATSSVQDGSEAGCGCAKEVRVNKIGAPKPTHYYASASCRRANFELLEAK
jgi:hypothetical protein